MANRIRTGVSGLDKVLCGGLVPARAYLARGGPGTGKTTLGLHFLATGVEQGEEVLYITLSEPEFQIRKAAQTIGFDLEGVSFLDLSPTSDFFAEVESYDIFSPAEVEREPTTQAIVERVKELKPTRVFLDSITQLRYLSTDTFQFHKQVLSFLRFLVEHDATVLATSEGSTEAPDEDLQFLSDAVINLDTGPNGRTLRVSKHRGSDFRRGAHSLRLTDEGMKVFPRLVPEEHRREFSSEPLSSGVPDLDSLLHGGLERGTVSIITGPTGVGKTSLGVQFMKEAAGRGQRSVLYAFEEEVGMLLDRCESISIPARKMIERGTLSVVNVEPLKYTPGEFAELVRTEVEEHDTDIVMVDSIRGYQLSLSGKNLVPQLHALCKYLQNVGVTTVLINEKEDMTGGFSATEVGISYMADNIIYLRYIEDHIGDQVELRKGIGVLKKRLSDFEKVMRELKITPYGIKIQDAPGLESILESLPVRTRRGGRHNGTV